MMNTFDLANLPENTIVRELKNSLKKWEPLMASSTMDTLREIAAPGYSFSPTDLKDMKVEFHDALINLFSALHDDERIRSESKQDAEIATSFFAYLLVITGIYDKDEGVLPCKNVMMSDTDPMAQAPAGTRRWRHS